MLKKHKKYQDRSNQAHIKRLTIQLIDIKKYNNNNLIERPVKNIKYIIENLTLNCIFKEITIPFILISKS